MLRLLALSLIGLHASCALLIYSSPLRKASVQVWMQPSLQESMPVPSAVAHNIIMTSFFTGPLCMPAQACLIVKILIVENGCFSEQAAQHLQVVSVRVSSNLEVMQVHTRTIRLTRRETSRKKWELIGECSVEQKAFTVSEVALLAKLVPLEVAWYYGDLDIEVDSLFHESASRMVVILRKPLDSGAV